MAFENNLNGFILEKKALYDDSLSWQAKGLYAYLMSRPGQEKATVRDLVKRSSNGRDSTAAALKELVSAGYINQ